MTAGTAGLRRVLAILAGTGLAAAVALAATWPAALTFATHTHGLFFDADLQVSIWWQAAMVEALKEGRDPFHALSLAWPDGQDTRLLLWNYAPQLLLAPIHWFTDPVLGLNLSSLAIMVLNGLAAGWAAHKATGSRAGALTGLVVGATSAYAWAEMGSGRAEQAIWAPVAIYIGGLIPLLKEPGTRRHILICALALAASGAIYWFYAYLLVICTGLMLAGIAIRRHLSRRTLWDFAWIGGVSLVLAAPFLIPVISGSLQATDAYHGITEQVANPIDMQANSNLVPMCYLGLLSNGRGFPSAQAPLLLLPICLLVAIRATGPVRAVAWMGMLTAIFAAGPVLMKDVGEPIDLFGYLVYLPMAALEVLPGFQRFWWPYRWLGLAIPVFAICAGWAICRFRRPHLPLALFTVLCVVECGLILRIYLPPPHHVEGSPRNRPISNPARIPAIFKSLAREPYPSPILQVPVAKIINGEVGWHAYHRQPIDGGVAWHVKGVRTAAYEKRRREVPLFVAVERASKDLPVNQKRRWSPKEAGGFRYVMLSRRYDEHSEVMLRGLKKLLAAPYYIDEMVALWKITPFL